MSAPPGRPAGSATDPLLDIRGLVTEFTTESGRIRAVGGKIVERGRHIGGE